MKKREIPIGFSFGCWTVVDELEPVFEKCGTKRRVFKMKCQSCQSFFVKKMRDIIRKRSFPENCDHCMTPSKAARKRLNEKNLKGYSMVITHFESIPCNTRSAYGVLKTTIKKDVTCKVCKKYIIREGL